MIENEGVELAALATQLLAHTEMQMALGATFFSAPSFAPAPPREAPKPHGVQGRSAWRGEGAESLPAPANPEPDPRRTSPAPTKGLTPSGPHGAAKLHPFTSAPKEHPIAEAPQLSLSPPPAVPPPVRAASSAPLPAAPLDRLEALRSLETSALGCTKCRLAQTRTKVVFGTGAPHAELVFVGEAPGRNEDLSGQPFVGEAGQLLDKIILAMGLDRSQVYICNVIKCRPPNNRPPSSDEIAQCEPWLLEQLSILTPKVICALGTYAAQTLLSTAESISRLRGRFFRYHEIELLATYHPAYLLRNPAAKKVVWEDMQKIQERLGIPPGSYAGKGPYRKGSGSL